MRYIREYSESFSYREVDKNKYEELLLKIEKLSKYELEMCVTFLSSFEKRGYEVSKISKNELTILYGGKIFGKNLTVNKVQDEYYLIMDYKFMPGRQPGPDVIHYYFCDGYIGLSNCIKDLTTPNLDITKGERYPFDRDELNILKRCSERYDFSFDYDKKVDEVNFRYNDRKYSIVKPVKNIYLVYKPDDKVDIILGRNQPHHYLFEYLPPNE